MYVHRIPVYINENQYVFSQPQSYGTLQPSYAAAEAIDRYVINFLPQMGVETTYFMSFSQQTAALD